MLAGAASSEPGLAVTTLFVPGENAAPDGKFPNFVCLRKLGAEGTPPRGERWAVGDGNLFRGLKGRFCVATRRVRHVSRFAKRRTPRLPPFRLQLRTGNRELVFITIHPYRRHRHTTTSAAILPLNCARLLRRTSQPPSLTTRNCKHRCPKNPSKTSQNR